jgi:hypothetical protein
VLALRQRLQDHDQSVHDGLWFMNDEFADENDEWVKALKPTYDQFVAAQSHPGEITDEDIPF